MKKNKARKPRPLHPFPLLACVPCDNALFSPPSPPPSSFTPKRVQYLSSLIKQGARVLLDIKAKRALVYDFAHGLRTVCEISIRMLSRLLKTGQVIPVAKQKNVVHYASIGCNRAWFADPDLAF